MLNFDGGRLSHAYIADGHIADTIAQTAVCSNRKENGPCAVCAHCLKAVRKIHPDIINISKLPTSKSDIITVDQIRELKKDAIVIPNEAQQKAYIINDAHILKNPEAQNAFLQILEEPPRHVVFILKTAYPTQLLPTILSRCIPIKSEQHIDSEMKTESTADESEIHDIVSQFYAALAKGNIAITEFMFVLETLNKEQFGKFISTARNEAALLIRSSPDNSADKVSMKTVVEAEKLLAQANGFLDLNVNVGHISGYICANLIRL